MGKRIIYVSRLMKGWEVREACKKFREQELTAGKGGSKDAKYRRDTHPGLSVACR